MKLGQHFGMLTISEKHARLMLCVDADEPSKAMIHWWTDDFRRAALADCTYSVQGLKLTLTNLYEASPQNGEIIYSKLTEAQAELIRSGYTVELKKKGNFLHGSWISPEGALVIAKVRINPQKTKALNATRCKTWSDFKLWSDRITTEGNAVSFRGHGNNSFELSTTLHRIGRNRLERYCWNELHTFRFFSEGVLNQTIDMRNGDDYGMLLGLAQHHGLPTPLLDWTRSPYIAAFFAFTDAVEMKIYRPTATHVRVYALTHEFLNFFSPRIVTLPIISSYVAALSVSPRLNPRILAQQGQFLVTNVANLQAFIHEIEDVAGKTFMYAADVPISCANAALRDLELMGLTAATLFPGLDGISRMIKYSMISKSRELPPAALPELSSPPVEH
ncbi:MAG: FRG domain-containing protein [Polaromonas sp.]|uniref:FRG domain-containing protein n=1 Tax=Polaromonas sp. TaxID=1869339 RepID=UPI00248969C1|nr:FRG domain-containing protein [Polaromonas sp.]MDI1239273.1 FRG domain-containing protein [Polaromonas sp.]